MEGEREMHRCKLDKRSEEMVRQDFLELHGGPPDSIKVIANYLERAVSFGIDAKGQMQILYFLKQWMEKCNGRISETGNPKRLP